MRRDALVLAGLVLIIVMVAFGSVTGSAASTPKAASLTPSTVTPFVAPPWTVSLDANSLTSTDVSVQSTNTPTKSFRVGAVIDASSTAPVIGVYGWEIGITYDNTTLVPQADPAAGAAGDGAQSTVNFGSQTGLGNPGWAQLISSGTAFGSFNILPIDATHEQIVVFFTLTGASPGVTIGPAVSGNLLANIAFEIVGKPDNPSVLSLTDLAFADPDASPIANINVGPDITETISDTPPVASFTVTPLASGDASCLPVTGFTCSPYAFKFDGSGSSDADGTIATPTGYFWDFGDGTQDNVNVGPCAPLTCNQGPIALHDYGASGAILPGTFTVTLRVVDSQGNTGSARDPFSAVIVNNQPSHTSQTLLADSPPTAGFTFTPASPTHGQTILFDGTTSTDDGTITSYSWDFGDGSTGTGSTITHSFATIGSYPVALTVTDNAGLTATVSHNVIVINLPPTVSFTESSSSVLRGQLITLSISANDPDGTVSSIQVDWGDGTIDNLPGNAIGDAHAYGPAGTYTVVVTATDDNGDTSAPAQATKTVTDAPPIAQFAESTTTTQTGTAISFDASDSSDPDGTILGYLWSFGDGNTATGVTATHTYDTAGTYTVTLAVTDDAAKTATATSAKTINDTPPVALFSESTSTSLTQIAISFDASASTDPDGTITSYTWNFGDGNAGTGQTTTHSYATAGTYTVTLTVMDDSGNTGTGSATKTITDRPPTVSFTETTTTSLTLESIILTITSSDSDGKVSTTTVDWGDTHVDILAGAATTDSHSYAIAGTYTVTVTVADDSGRLASSIADKTITDRPPIALFSESSTTMVVGGNIHFDASGSSDPDGAIVDYSWDFGDGTAGTGVNADHAYSTSSTFTVTLTVRDNSGNTATAAATKTSINGIFLPAFTESTTTALTLDGISFDASTSQDNTGTIILYQWDFGDGSPLATGQVSVDHAYGKAGTYTVALTIADDVGQTGTAASTKTILDRPPTAMFTEDKTSALTRETIGFDASLTNDSDGTAVTYSWDFGDASTSSGAFVSHSYAAAGTYIVTLTVTDDDGLTGSQTSTKTISDQPPIVIFQEDQSTALTGETITLAISSSDSDGTIIGTMVDWGDGTVNSLPGAATTDNHPYSKAGSFTVTVTVTDDAGLTGSSQATKTINDRPPVASFTEAATTALTGAPINFDASASTDPDGSIVTYSWDFGDGSTDAGLTVNHSFAKAGQYTVTLTVTDDNGLTGSQTSAKTIDDQPPSVTFTEDKTSALTGETISLTITSSDVDGTVTGTQVDWGDGTVNNLAGAASNDSHSYSKAGSFTVTVTVTDDAGLTSNSQSIKTVNDRPPIASFSESSTTVLTGVSINFDASTSSDPDGSINAYSWDFGDGNTDAGQTVSHAYAKAGIYLVTLTVTDDNNSQNSSTSTKTINDQSPVASFIESLSTAPTGTSIVFDSSTSSDPDGSIAAYAWDFGDGSKGTGVAPSHPYGVAGTYTVTLIVIDDNGSTNTVSGLKTITDRPPVASFTESTTSVLTGTLVQFGASSSSDPDGTIVIYSWDFGDGSTGSGVTVDHGYSIAGPYTVTLTVTDDSGNLDTASALKTIIDRPPVAVFTESATTSLTLSGISFNASASSDLDGTIVAYSWDFGDGNAGTGQTTTHSFAAAGTYTVTLTVTDDSGNTNTGSATKTITDRPPVASFSESMTQALTQIAISFNASSSADVDGSITIYSWSFGDGSTGSGAIVLHSYATAGSYTVNLTVTDDSGNAGTASSVKSIGDRPPVASFTVSTTTVVVGKPLNLDGSGSSDPDGTISNYSWSFGDSANGTASFISHIYNTTGTFQVVLVVTDNSGSTGSVSQLISVILPPKVVVTFEAYDAEDFFKGVGTLDARLNGTLVVNVPAGLFQLPGTGHYAPLAKVWASLGPFDVTNMVQLGTNTLVFSNPLQSHITLIRNVKVVTGDGTVLLDKADVGQVGPRDTYTLRFSLPTLTVASLAISPDLVYNTEERTFTAFYEGGVGPFTCTFEFGDGARSIAHSKTQVCSAVHTYWLGDENTWWDAGGNFTVTVQVVGANTGDSAANTFPVEVLRQPSFTGPGLTWTRSITSSVQAFNAQIANLDHSDLLIRVDFAIYTPSGGTDAFTSPSFHLLAGETRNNISFTYTPKADGWYCFQGTLTYGRDLNHDGVLQDLEVRGTKHAEYGCFQVN